MSSQERKLERARQLEAACAAAEKECSRKTALSMWERIEECRDFEDVRAILHQLAEHAGME